MTAQRIAVTTGNHLEGHEISEYLGIVRGIVVRAQTITQGIRGAFFNPLPGAYQIGQSDPDQYRNTGDDQGVDKTLQTDPSEAHDADVSSKDASRGRQPFFAPASGTHEAIGLGQPARRRVDEPKSEIRGIVGHFVGRVANDDPAPRSY